MHHLFVRVSGSIQRRGSVSLLLLPWWPWDGPCSLRLTPPPIFFFSWIPPTQKKPVLSSPSPPILLRQLQFEENQRTGKRKRTRRLRPSLLHLLHLSTVGFNSAIILPLTLLALLMPITVLLKTVNLSACCCCHCSVLLGFAPLSLSEPESFVRFQPSASKIINPPTPSCWTVFSTVWQNEQIDDF